MTCIVKGVIKFFNQLSDDFERIGTQHSQMKAKELAYEVGSVALRVVGVALAILTVAIPAYLLIDGCIIVNNLIQGEGSTDGAHLGQTLGNGMARVVNALSDEPEKAPVIPWQIKGTMTADLIQRWRFS